MHQISREISMKKTIDKFVYFIVIAAVMSSIYSIYIWYQRGGFELVIIDKMSKIIFMLSMFFYYRKGNPVMLLFMALSLVVCIMLFVELYNWYVAQNRLLSNIFILVIFIAGFIYFLYTALKRRM